MRGAIGLLLLLFIGIFYAAIWIGILMLEIHNRTLWIIVNSIIALLTIFWFVFFANSREAFFKPGRWLISLFLIMLFTVTVGWSLLRGWVIIFGAALSLAFAFWDVRGMVRDIRKKQKDKKQEGK